MEEERARRVVDTLRARNVLAHVKLPQAGVTQYGIRVVLPDGREAIWDNDGTAGLEAQIMRNGILVGFVASIPESENFGDGQIVDAIATADPAVDFHGYDVVYLVADPDAPGVDSDATKVVNLAEPLVADGRDIVSVHISGGISGTVEAARQAAAELAGSGSRIEATLW